jgi:hypothetical protein
MTSRRWRVGRASADQPWLTALNQLQPGHLVPGSAFELALTAAFDQGRNAGISGCTSISGTHATGKSGKLCVGFTADHRRLTWWC